MRICIERGLGGEGQQRSMAKPAASQDSGAEGAGSEALWRHDGEDASGGSRFAFLSGPCVH